MRLEDLDWFVTPSYRSATHKGVKFMQNSKETGVLTRQGNYLVMFPGHSRPTMYDVEPLVAQVLLLEADKGDA